MASKHVDVPAACIGRSPEFRVRFCLAARSASHSRRMQGQPSSDSDIARVSGMVEDAVLKMPHRQHCRANCQPAQQPIMCHQRLWAAIQKVGVPILHTSGHTVLGRGLVHPSTAAPGSTQCYIDLLHACVCLENIKMHMIMWNVLLKVEVQRAHISGSDA